VCAALAVRDYGATAAVHISYGQRTEERSGSRFWRFAGGSTFSTSSWFAMTRYPPLGARLSPTKASPSRIPMRQGRGLPGQGIPGGGVPVTYVPFRNAHFLAVAVSWAEVLGAEKCISARSSKTVRVILIAVPLTIKRSTRWCARGRKKGRIEIVTPLIALRKSQIVQLGLELGAPFDLTWSCYRREDLACGTCDSCVLRVRAFQAAGVKDPISYVEAVR
jgi:7-cyano-7-deazaguanine synthase